MFRIFENGTEIGVADKLNFIKKADNGCFVLCTEEDAQGIAFNGEAFTLGTNGGIENVREVQFCEVSTAVEVQGAHSRANRYEQNYQAQYDYYKAGNSKVKYRHDSTGTAVWYWCRSADYHNSVAFCFVHTDGTNNHGSALFSYGLAPGFCV